MIAKRKRPFFVVYQDEALELGTDAALLLAELRYLSRTLRKDDYGYFRAESAHLREMLGFGKDKLQRTRKKLIDTGRIDYIQGQNQNQKPRYKML